MGVQTLENIHFSQLESQPYTYFFLLLTKVNYENYSFSGLPAALFHNTNNR